MKWLIDLFEDCFYNKWKLKYEEERKKYLQLKGWTEQLILSNQELLDKIN